MSGQEPTRKRGGAAPVAGPHPAPEVLCREATETEIGRSARAMRKLGLEHGWAVKVTYARGTAMTTKGKAGKVVDSIVVRLHAANRAAWGAWNNGRYDSGQTWERGDTASRGANATELAAFVANGVISDWP